MAEEGDGGFVEARLGGGGADGVVVEGDAAEGDDAGRVVVEAVGGARIGVARVADGAGVDDVALALLDHEVLRGDEVRGAAFAQHEDAGDVGVADEDELGVGGAPGVEGLLRRDDVVEGLRAVERAVDADEALPFEYEGLLGQEGLGLGRDAGGRPADHGLREVVEGVVRHLAGDDGVVVAHDEVVDVAVGRFEDGLGLRSVSDDIPEADDLPRLQRGEVRQHRVPGGQVGVDVGYDGVAHVSRVFRARCRRACAATRSRCAC